MSALMGRLEILVERLGLILVCMRTRLLSLFMHDCGKGTAFFRGSRIYRKGFISVGARCNFLEGSVLDARKASPEKVRIILGDDVVVGQGAFVVAHGGLVRLGSNVHIGPKCHLQGPALEIGRDSILGPGVMIFSSNHEYALPDETIREQGESSQGVSIGDNAWIGAGAIIVDGVQVASNSVIAAGAVVTRDVPANSVVGGTPAKVLKMTTGKSS